jgi:hypothetical protein
VRAALRPGSAVGRKNSSAISNCADGG